MTLPGPSDLTQWPSVGQLLHQHGLWAKQSLGQNFLNDLNITRKIVQAAGDLSHSTVIEIGPGPGGLTRALLESKARHIIAIEKDDRFIEILSPLQEFVGKERFSLLHANALQVSIDSLGSPPRKIVANLPYNIATVLLIQWLKSPGSVTDMTLMFQREVAERLLAPVGNPAYGRLSVFVQALCHAELVMTLPPSVFVPAPKVYSSVVHLSPFQAPRIKSQFGNFERVVASAFGQRRKMLRASLKTLPQGVQALEFSGIDPTRRAETLSVAEFDMLTLAYEQALNII